MKQVFHSLPNLPPLRINKRVKMLLTERKNSRGKIEILADILSNCREGLKKTHIMLRANLGYEQICYYLPALIRANLINQEIEAGSVIYRTTENGRQFLLNYYNIRRLIHHENVNPAQTEFTIENDLCLEKSPVIKSSERAFPIHENRLK